MRLLTSRRAATAAVCVALTLGAAGPAAAAAPQARPAQIAAPDPASVLDSVQETLDGLLADLDKTLQSLLDTISGLLPGIELPEITLPEITLPELPDIPQVPEVPQVPEAPGIPATTLPATTLPALPEIPAAPEIPAVPNVPAMEAPAVTGPSDVSGVLDTSAVAEDFDGVWDESWDLPDTGTAPSATGTATEQPQSAVTLPALPAGAAAPAPDPSARRAGAPRHRAGPPRPTERTRPARVPASPRRLSGIAGLCFLSDISHWSENPTGAAHRSGAVEKFPAFRVSAARGTSLQKA